MKLTVLGGAGGYPGAGQACSGYLVEEAGFRLLVDPGYATLPYLQRYVGVDEVDAVYVSHGHPDHCADLNPLLRARALRAEPIPALPVYALPGALAAVLALDRPGMLAEAYTLHEFAAGDHFTTGPFAARTTLLPHFLPNAGIRLSTDHGTLAYTGDTGACPEIVELAHDADLFLAEATFVDEVPPDNRDHLNSARLAGEQASAAGVGRLALTHLWPDVDPSDAIGAAAKAFRGPIEVARIGLTVTLP